MRWLELCHCQLLNQRIICMNDRYTRCAKLLLYLIPARRYNALGSLFNEVAAESSLDGIDSRAFHTVVPCQPYNEDIRDSLGPQHRLDIHINRLRRNSWVEIPKSICKGRVHLDLRVFALLNEQVNTT